MSEKIAPGVNWYDRKDWGARTDIPRLGQLVNPLEATEAILHHTVAIDNDATPNIWEDLPECFVKMRQLQTIRPDLGLDVPYSAVAFMLRYANGTRELALMEGRGFDRRGAHTSYHNRTGRAIAVEGNLQLFVDVHPYAQMLSWAWGWAKERHGLENLGTVHPTGRAVYGHRNFAQTACPGQSLMAVIDSIKIEAYQPPQEEDEMKPYLAWDIDRKRVYYIGVGGAAWIVNAADVDTLKALHGITDLVPLTASAIQGIQSAQIRQV